MEYFNKRAMGETESRFVLEEDALAVESAGRSVRVPFADLREIRLRYQPNRYELDVYECDIAAAQGEYRIFSRYVTGLLQFRNQGPAYRLFISELCLRCARAGARTRFSGGASVARYIGVGLACFTGLGLLFAVLALLPFSGGFLVIVRLVLIVPMLLVSSLWFVKNRPARFDPAAIPDSLLPSP